MNRKLILSVSISILIIILLGIFLITRTNSESNSDASFENQTVDKIVVSSPVSSEISNSKMTNNQACSIVTADIINQSLNLNVQIKNSTTTSCTFTSDDSSSVVVQVFTDNPDLYYSPYQYEGIVELANVGDKAFYQNPIYGNSNAQIVKGNKMLMLTIFSNNGYTGDNIGSLMEASVVNL